VNSALPANSPVPTVRGCRRVLFVCLGNICRSPLAQGVFEHLTEARGVRSQFTIESCGIGGWHAGDPPDPRTVEVARRNGIELRSRARQLEMPRDFERFELIPAMDRRNLRNLTQSGCPASRAALFLSFAPATIAEPVSLEVPDPYYGGPEGFEEVYRLVYAGAEGLLNAVL
jgi:protein-tyrosine phosphatase